MRPTLGQVRQDVADGLFDILVCHDVDRFGRNLGHQILLEEEFAKQGVEVKYVLGDYKDTAEGRLTKHIKGVIAEYEREKIIERTFRGRLGRARSGQVNISANQPYGYTYRGEERSGWLEIMPEEAEIVREIFHFYVEEVVSCQEIAARLTERQVPTRSGCQQWSPSTIRGMLRNETYAGIWHDNKRKRGKGRNPQESWVPVAVPPIIPRELWEAAQERIATNRERLRRRPKYSYLLSGILSCGSCGRAFIGMTSVPGHDRRPKAYHYYRCGLGQDSRGAEKP
jgi:site-specific DNA recombinase